MDFSIFSRTRFKAGVEIHFRIFRLTVQRNGLLMIQNIKTGEIIFKDLDPVTVTVVGQPYSFKAMEAVLYHKECICDVPDSGGDFKIFDLSFDYTFE